MATKPMGQLGGTPGVVAMQPVFYFPHQSPVSHTFVRARTQWIPHWGGCPTLPPDRARDVEHTCPTPISQRMCSNYALSPLGSFQFT